MKTIAIVNEKGGTGKTTTAVNLAASLGELGQKVLLVDLDGQAAASRWFGVEEDNRLSDAMLRGGGLVPIPNIAKNVWLAPASGRLDSISHELRPTQGGQLRKVLSEHTDYDYTLIDSPPSLGNKLIGNALLAATHAIAPVEPSILALDGLGILLTTLGDIRDGFDHNIILIGALACRYDSRTKLSRLVLEELRRALPGRVFQTVIRETVRMQECPASGTSILEFSPRSVAAKDYLDMARELIAWPPKGVFDEEIRQRLAEQCALDPSHIQPTDMGNLRKDAIAAVMEATGMQPRFHNDDEIKQLNDLDEELVEVDQDEQVEASAEDQQQEGEVQPVAADESETWTEPAEAEIESEPVAIEPIVEEETGTPVEAQAIEQSADDAPDADSEAGSEAWTVPVSAEADAPAETVDIEESDHIEAPDELTFGKRLARTTVGPAVLFVGLVLLGLIVASGGRPSPQMASANAAAGSWQEVTLEQTDAASVFESPETLAAEAEAIAQSADAQQIDDVLYEETDATQVTPQPVEELISEIEEAIEQLQDEPSPAVPAEPKYRICPPGYKLTCVFASPNGSQAIINGQLVRVGHTVQGAKVLAITAQSVEMELDSERFILGIGEQATNSPQISE